MSSFATGSPGFILVTLFVLCLPFEDSILQLTGIGYFGSNLALLPLCLMLLVYPGWARNRRFLGIVVLTVFCSVVGLLLNPGMVGAAIGRGMRFFVIWMTFFACLFWFRRWHDAFVPLHAYLLMAILTLSMLMELVAHDYLLGTSLFHANVSGNMRPRGFSGESSQFGYQVITGFLFCGWLLRKKLGFLLVAVAASFLSGSKGTLACLAMSMFLATVWTSKGKLTKAAVGVLAVPVVILVFNVFLLDRFRVDLEDYTSISSRLTLTVLAVQSFADNPFGYGMTGFATMFATNGPNAIAFLESYGLSGLSFAEVKDIFDPTETKNLGLKSLFLEMATIYGIFGIYLIQKNARAAVRYFSGQRDIIGLTLVFFMLLSNLFFVSPVAAYLTPMVIGVVLGRMRADSQLVEEVK
ncbi:O-antigen ligase family protein [Massilia sp. SYSU DXS3249]